MVRVYLLLGFVVAASIAGGQQPVISTISGGTPPVTPVSAATASIGDPPRVAVDSAGNVYFAGLHSVFRANPGGTLTRIAGTGRAGYSGDGGSALNAQLDYPDGIAIDSAGNVYVADKNSAVIRRIAVNGTIATVAGTGTAGFSGDGGPAQSAQLNVPQGLAVDTAGNLYIADSGNQRVRRISPSGAISTVAGTGFPGYNGDGIPAASAQLNMPEGVTLDAAGNLYIADTDNNRVRMVSPAGAISTVAGNGLSAVAASIYDGTGGAATTGDNGPATAASVVLPTAVAFAGGVLYVADYGNGRIRRVVNGTIDTVAGRSDGIALTAGQAADSTQLNGLTGLAADAAGSLYFTEGSIGTGSGLNAGNFRVWKVTPQGVLAVAAGNGLASYSGDGGAAAVAELDGPAQIAMDTAGTLYFADFGNNRVRRITLGGVIETLAGNGVAGFSGDGGPAVNARLNGPMGVAVDAQGTVFIADTGNNRIRKVSPDGSISTWAGNGNAAFFGDGGPAILAALHQPLSLAVDRSGNLFAADSLNHRIRRIAPDGTIVTVAGSGIPGFSGDGGAALKAQLNQPSAVALDAARNVYIADTGNRKVRVLSPSGNISSLTGNPSLDTPLGLAVDGSGKVYIADAGLRKIVAVAPDGTVSTAAGSGQCCYSGDGGPAAGAALNQPRGVIADGSSAVIFTDFADNAIRAVRSASALPSIQTVANGASNQAGPITPGELVVIFGNRLGPLHLDAAAPGSSPLQLDGVSVLFNGAPGQMLYVSATQVSAVVPAGVSGPSVTVVVQNGILATAAATVPLTNAAPALFARDGSGFGQAAALNADGTPNESAKPAPPGSVVTLFATGTGGLPVTLNIGGKAATVVSIVGTDTGVIEIAVEVPHGLPAGPAQVLLQAGGVNSPGNVTLAVAAQ